MKIIIGKLLLLLLCHNLIVSSVSASPGHDHFNRPELNSSYGAGHVEELGGLKAYVSGSFHSKRVVLLISDIFGYEAPKLRKLADKVATAGFYAVVPDFFRGDPFNPNDTSRPLEVWLKDHTPEQGFKDAKPIIEALKCKGLTNIGAAGFCWGGKVAVELSKSTSYVQAQVLLHPSFVTVDDIKDVKVATSILGAEKDVVSPPALVKQFEKALKAKPEIHSFVKIFRGVEHGWTIRYEDGDKLAVKSAKRAHRYMLHWFAKYLK